MQSTRKGELVIIEFEEDKLEESARLQHEGSVTVTLPKRPITWQYYEGSRPLLYETTME